MYETFTVTIHIIYFASTSGILFLEHYKISEETSFLFAFVELSSMFSNEKSWILPKTLSKDYTFKQTRDNMFLHHKIVMHVVECISLTDIFATSFIYILIHRK
jgi:hypothetical protein